MYPSTSSNMLPTPYSMASFTGPSIQMSQTVMAPVTVPSIQMPQNVMAPVTVPSIQMPQTVMAPVTVPSIQMPQNVMAPVTVPSIQMPQNVMAPVIAPALQLQHPTATNPLMSSASFQVPLKFHGDTIGFPIKKTPMPTKPEEVIGLGKKTIEKMPGNALSILWSELSNYFNDMEGFERMMCRRIGNNYARADAIFVYLRMIALERILQRQTEQAQHAAMLLGYNNAAATGQPMAMAQHSMFS